MMPLPPQQPKPSPAYLASLRQRKAASKIADADWGSEEAYFSQPPVNVPADAWWISIIGFYLLLPLNILVALLCTFLNPFYRWVGSLAMCSTLMGRPLCLAFAWWWYQVAGALQLLVRSGKSRFTFFSRSHAIYGGGNWWWHGEGAWNCPYAGVRETMASDQLRRPAFGAVATCVSELFPAEMLLFLDGENWKVTRSAIEMHLTNTANWMPRVGELPALLATLAPTPCTLATLDKPTSDKMVATAVWFLLFGVKLTPEQAAIIMQWGASGLAGLFVFPRMIHRIAFNLLLGKVKKLRRDTLGVFKAHGLQAKAAELNETLGPHKRKSALAFADELMYAVNFAGVGGTQHGCWGTLQFLQKKTIDVAQSAVTFPEGSMAALYKADPSSFVKECVRLDAPVTSATCAFAKPTTVAFDNSFCGCGASAHDLPEGTLHQYVLSIANRDPAQFESADTFMPTRPNLNEHLGWNGALSTPEAYPRICPGRDLSVEVIKAVVSLVEEVA